NPRPRRPHGFVGKAPAPELPRLPSSLRLRGSTDRSCQVVFAFGASSSLSWVNEQFQLAPAEPIGSGSAGLDGSAALLLSLVRQSRRYCDVDQRDRVVETVTQYAGRSVPADRRCRAE